MGICFILAEDEGFEPNGMRYAGGISLPPVHKLVASLIFTHKSG